MWQQEQEQGQEQEQSLDLPSYLQRQKTATAPAPVLLRACTKSGEIKRVSFCGYAVQAWTCLGIKMSLLD